MTPLAIKSTKSAATEFTTLAATGLVRRINRFPMKPYRSMTVAALIFHKLFLSGKT